MFEDHNEDDSLYKINHQQYQSFSGKKLLSLNQYLEQIRPKLTELMTNDCKVKLNVNAVFRSKINLNDERNVFIESEDKTYMNEIFDQLIKKHEKLIGFLKEINFIPEGIELIT